MIAYIVRRCISTVVLLLLIATVVFLFLHLLPGDPAIAILGGVSSTPDAAAIARVHQELGLDKPLYVQYADWMANLARFNLGNSFTSGTSVGGELMRRLPRTLMLIVPAEILAIVIGIPLGIAAARLRRTAWDPTISAFALIGFSTPVFVSGLLMVLLFSLKLHWLPAGGFVSPATDFGGFVKSAILPVITLSLGPMATTMRMTRSSMLEQMGLDYVRTARSKGVTERVVLFRHVLRNALLPVVTIIGLHVGFMFAGSVLVEDIFNWPGINSYLLNAIGARDYPVVQGIVIVVATIFILINFVTDLSFAVLDPRIRYE
ncbi:MAG TPA: ABC transporter permease [Thermomicrobiaceae bacterium]|nr:ABC transporter permease [Thermomicrobiaceae bacterium]